MDLNVKQLFTSRTLKTNFSTNFGHINIDLNNYSHQGHFKAILPCFFVLDANKYSHRGHIEFRDSTKTSHEFVQILTCDKDSTCVILSSSKIFDVLF